MSTGPLPPLPNIYIIGAQSTGKTTLLNALEASLDPSVPPPSIIRELARSVVSQTGITAAAMRTSPHLCSALQTQIMKAQHASEEEALRKSTWFISDRSGLDPLVYAEKLVGPALVDEMTSTAEWPALRASLARSLIFLCEPITSWLVDDGVRLMPADEKDWQDYHAEFCARLSDLGLPYRVVPATMPDVEARARLVWEEWKGKRSELVMPG